MVQVIEGKAIEAAREFLSLTASTTLTTSTTYSVRRPPPFDGVLFGCGGESRRGSDLG